MGWGRRAGIAVSALVVAAAFGTAIDVATAPSPATTASSRQTATPRLADGAIRSAHHHWSRHPHGTGATTTTTTPPAPTTTTPTSTTTLPMGPTVDASPKNPYVAALAARMAPVVRSAPGCEIVSQGRQVLYQSNPTLPVQPGSTQKLLVAAAALDVLGPDYTFTTEVVAPAAPVNGVVSSLWLVGGGDPVLEEPAFNAWWVSQPRYSGDPYTNIDTLAAAVRAAGVTTVIGPISGDDARYDSVRLNPYWPPYTEADGDIAPMSALTLDMGFQSWTTDAPYAPDPATFAAASFAQLLTTAGVKDPDDPPGGDSTPPAGSVVIASIHSPPLSQIIGAMLRPSNNQIAELMVKELGYHATGLGTTAAGLAVVKSVDIGLGIPWDSTVMYDGSGLSHDDHTTCQTLLAAFYLGDKPRFAAIPEGLPVGGVDGTLATWFPTPPLKGHVIAKTGNINGAWAMVGEIDIGKPVRFAVVFNQPVSEFVLIQDLENAVNAIAPYP
jgi:serine-type D-Ala-D-Ala carboxypeptidase/endopeptidase (penicillin-binding protein 4)